MNCVIVLRSENLYRLAAFYQTLGLTLNLEQHGAGPEHYSGKLGETLFECCPTVKGTTQSDVMIIFYTNDSVALEVSLAEANISFERSGDKLILNDPDGRPIRVYPMPAP
jgi:lactoylglutathione lyase